MWLPCGTTSISTVSTVLLTCDLGALFSRQYHGWSSILSFDTFLCVGKPSQGSLERC